MRTFRECLDLQVPLPGERGEVSANSYSTVVYYHVYKPQWNETVKIRVSFEQFLDCHVRFLIRHKSKNEDKNSLYAVAFLNLADEVNRETAIKDAVYDLVVFDLVKGARGRDISTLAAEYLELQHIKSGGTFRRHHNEEKSTRYTYTIIYLCCFSAFWGVRFPSNGCNALCK